MYVCVYCRSITTTTTTVNSHISAALLTVMYFKLRLPTQVFPTLIMLRKLCNHPDLATGGPRNRDVLGEEVPEDEDTATDSFPWLKFGCPRRSSKMLVVASLLRTWHRQGHRALLFSQSRRVRSTCVFLCTNPCILPVISSDPMPLTIDNNAAIPVAPITTDGHTGRKRIWRLRR